MACNGCGGVSVSTFEKVSVRLKSGQNPLRIMTSEALLVTIGPDDSVCIPEIDAIPYSEHLIIGDKCSDLP